MSILKKSIIASAALALPFAVSANSKLEKMMKDPSQWVQQSGDYAGHRYSNLDQINKSNVGSLKVAWSFSTGVLRGHEGSPLVIGDVMYVHTAIPNIVYALEVKSIFINMSYILGSADLIFNHPVEKHRVEFTLLG